MWAPTCHGSTSPNATKNTIALLSIKGTLLAHMQLGVHQDPRSLSAEPVPSWLAPARPGAWDFSSSGVGLCGSCCLVCYLTVCSSTASLWGSDWGQHWKPLWSPDRQHPLLSPCLLNLSFPPRSSSGWWSISSPGPCKLSAVQQQYSFWSVVSTVVRGLHISSSDEMKFIVGDQDVKKVGIGFRD